LNNMFNISTPFPACFLNCYSIMQKKKQILLISDDQEKSTVLHNVLTNYHPDVAMKVVEKFQQSDISFGKELPAMIILLVSEPDNSHMTWLKKIRVAKKLKEIPVFVYNELPGKDEMQELVSSLGFGVSRS
jgi:DNA-binding response OmpR family regulator